MSASKKINESRLRDHNIEHIATINIYYSFKILKKEILKLQAALPAKKNIIRLLFFLNL